MTISAIFYWGLIEAALALIASCLPTLSVLAKHRAVQSVINSARSAISLRSIRSHGSNSHSSGSRGSRRAGATQRHHVGGQGTDTSLLRGEPEAQITSDIRGEIAEPQRTLQPGTIRIKHELNTEENIV